MDRDQDVISDIRLLLSSRRMREAIEKAKQIGNSKQKAAAFLLVAKSALELEESSPDLPVVKDLRGLFGDTPCKILAEALGELARLGYSKIAENVAKRVSDPLCYAKCLKSIAKGKLDLAKAKYEMVKSGLYVDIPEVEDESLLQEMIDNYLSRNHVTDFKETLCREFKLDCPQMSYERITNSTLVSSLGRLRRVKIDVKEFYLVKCTRFSCVLVTDGYAIKVPQSLIKGKYIRPSITSNEISRFTSEAERAVLLDHPNIVKLYDYLIDPPLLVYERADCDLESILSQHGPLSLEVVARITIDICNGLKHIHSKGFIHGDLKPSNILIFGNRIKIGDLGALVNAMRLLTTPAIEFTPRYCAPEQAKLKDGEYTSLGGNLYAIDVYQLANLILELLGIDPLSGLDWSTESLSQKLDLVRSKYKDNELVELIGRMLSKEPSKRPSLSEVESLMRKIISRSCRDGERVKNEKAKEPRRGRGERLKEFLEALDAAIETWLSSLTGQT